MPLARPADRNERDQIMEYISCYHTFYRRGGQECVRTHYERFHAETDADAIGKFMQRHAGQDCRHQYTEPVVEEVEEDLDEIYASVA